MRIGLDARFWGPQTSGGIGRYVEELGTQLALLKSKDSYVFFMNEGRPVVPAGIERRMLDIPWYGLREQIEMAPAIDNEKLDLVHIPHWNVSRRMKTPFVATIHDLILLDEPRSSHATTRNPLVAFVKRLGFHGVLRHALFASRRLIVPSDATKQSILTHFPKLSAQKITIIHEGVTTLLATAAPIPVGLQGTQYILAVGSAYPHKNLDGLLAAFAILRKKFPLLRLALAGRQDIFYDRLRAKLQNHLREAVQFVMNPSDAQLRGLYEAAALYVFPSHLEGFGLPPLEAMQAGLPVAASNRGSLPEILGDAAVYFPPENTHEMASVIERLLTNKTLRRAVITKGQAQTKRYSWKRMAEETAAVYHAAL